VAHGGYSRQARDMLGHLAAKEWGRRRRAPRRSNVIQVTHGSRILHHPHDAPRTRTASILPSPCLDSEVALSSPGGLFFIREISKINFRKITGARLFVGAELKRLVRRSRPGFAEIF